MNKLIFFLTATLLLIGSPSQAQQQDILTNESIISMYTKKLPASIIMGKIKVAKNCFDVSTEALIVLVQDKLPEDIINAMVEAANDPSKYCVKIDPNNPMDMHEPGIYYFKKKGESKELLQMEPSSYNQVKSKGSLAFALTYGIAKIKQGVTLDGKDSHLQLSEQQPEFYFYFDLSGKSLNNTSNWWFSAATSPSEFQLVLLSEKEKTREVITATASIASSSSGVDDANKAAFKYEKIGQGIYRVFFEKPLTGEYCFMYSGNLPKDFETINKVYDFGIKLQ